MILLSYPLFDYPIEIKENEVNVLVLESPKCFRKFIYEIKETIKRDESKIHLSKDYEEVCFDKYVFPVFSVEGININSKKVLSKVYSDLKNLAYSETMYGETMRILNQTVIYMDNLISNYELSLFFDDFNIDVLLKSVDIKIESDEKEFLKMLCDYIDVVSNIFNIHIFIFFHLKEYLEEFELLELYKHCNYRKINLILCENTVKKICHLKN